jgi:hypothetical protein
MTRATLLLLLLAGPGPAQSIEAPAAPVPAHRLARLRATGVESAAWIVVPVGVADVEPSPDGKACVLAAPPGTYTVLAAATAGGKPLFLSATITFAGGPQPQPPPPPSPQPQPQPAGDLERAAAAYARAVPVALREAAARVRDGRARTVGEAQDVVLAAVGPARADYGRAIDAATAGMFDQGGKILRAADYAAALERAAAAMGGR